MNDNSKSPVNWHVGQRVITRDGVVATVTHTDGLTVYGVGPCDSIPRPIRPVGDAWGGESDVEVGLQVAA